jgi:hypothetical protein
MSAERRGFRENVIDGKIVCDYCHGLMLMRKERARRFITPVTIGKSNTVKGE